MEKFMNNYDKFFEETKSTFEKDNITMPEDNDAKLMLFVNNWYPHMEAVSKGDYKYFIENKVDPELFVNLKFQEAYKDSSNENQNIIWEYLQTLYALSASLVKERDDLNDDVKKNIENFPNIIANIVMWKRNKKPDDKPSEKPKLDKNFIENSSIAKLAKEISEEIDAKEMLNLGEDMKNMDNPMKLIESLMSGDNKSGIAKLMTEVSGKLKTKMDSGDINQEQLLKEATSLLGNLGGGGDENGPDLSSVMDMARNLSSMSSLFEGAGQKPPSARKVKRKIKRKNGKK